MCLSTLCPFKDQKCIFNQTACSNYCFLLCLDPACLKINKEYRCYVSDPFCQPIEPSKETDTNYEAIIYPCIGVLVAVVIIAVICLYLRNKLQRRLNCKEESQKEEGNVLNVFSVRGIVRSL